MKKLILFSLLFVACYTNAQMYVWQNGRTTEFEVNSVDSITFQKYESKYQALSGEFSVSPTRKVRFAAGNLGYVFSKNEWIFMEQQYQGSEYSLKDNYTVLNKKNTYLGIAHDTIGAFFGSNIYNLHGLVNIAGYSNEFADWGELIGDGWRTLTADEWTYLMNTRYGATIKHTIATINNVYGILLLPDNYSSTLINIQFDNVRYYSSNIFDLETWALLEQEGAVFLPAILYDNYANWAKGKGAYWLNGYEKCSNGYEQKVVYFEKYYSSDGKSPYKESDYNPCNVRLVKESL